MPDAQMVVRKMSRAATPVLALIALVAAVLPGTPPPCGHGSVMASACAENRRALPALTVEEIVPGFYVSQGRYETVTPENRGQISNIGFVVGDEAVAVIDTGGSAAVGRALLAAIRKTTDLPIRYVINTHMHPDHLFGNAAFSGEDTKFVGHHKLTRALQIRGAHYLQSNRELIGGEAFEGTEIIPPTLTVRDSLILDLGGRELRLVAHATAHTDNDLTVFDSKTRTLWLGDLLFARHIPVIDGSITGWLDAMKTLTAMDAARVVPGHGPVTLPWPGGADAQLHYLSGLRDAVRNKIAEGATLGEAASTVTLDKRDDWLLGEEFHARNIAAAFTALEWE